MLALFPGLGQDVRYALRGWRQRPWFTAALLAMLALGIAAVTGIFAIAYAELWRPSPYLHPEQLVVVHGEWQGRRVQLTPAEYRLLLLTAPGLQAAGAIFYGPYQSLLTGNRSESIPARRITPGFLPLLGVSPALGRNFSLEEAVPGHDGVALISQSLWTTHFGRRPDVLGQRLHLDDRIYTIIGVMPPHFDEGTRGGDAVWLPAAFNARDLSAQGARSISAWVRLNPGLTWQQEKPRLEAYSAALHLQLGNSPLVFGGQRYTDELHASPGRILLLTLLAAVSLLLLIACANAAGLLLARGLERRQEIAVRQALGARRSRILRQLLTEGAILALAAVAIGLLLARWTIAWLHASPLDRSLEHLNQARMSPAVLAFALVFTVLSVLAFSLAPALRLTKPLPTGLAQRGPGRAHPVFLVVEIALTFVLLVGAGLMGRSLFRLLTNNPGLDLNHLAAVEFSFSPSQRRDPLQVAASAQRMLAALRGRPGWRNLAIASAPPLDNDFYRDFTLASVQGRQGAPIWEVGAGYFKTVGQRILFGRDFNEHDSAAAPGVVIVNQSFVRFYLHGASPLGKQLLWASRGSTSATPHTIVGIVNDARDAIPDLESIPAMYVPFAQSGSRTLALIVNAADPGAALTGIRDLLSTATPDLAISTAQPLRTLFDDDISRPRFQDLMLITFAGLALLFALSGTWALVACAVQQRRREFGIRLVLGASTMSLLRGAVAQAVGLIGLGILIGLPCAWFASRLLTTLLYATRPGDPVAYLLVTGAFAAVALLAAYLPARRACSTDPAITLRCE